MSASQVLDEKLRGTHLVFNPSFHITKRKAQVLLYASEGMSNKEIAEVMGLSPKTVEVHLCFARSALGAATTAEAIARAVYLGLAYPAHHDSKE